MKPPIAKTEPRETTVHGYQRSDPYAWLRDKQSPDVRAYLEAENAYTDEAMAHTKDLQARLYKEMVGRIQETDLSVPVRRDDFFYYSRTEEGLQYPIYCRKAGSLEADEEVLLDLNEEASGHDYFALGVFEVSPDHRLLAYATDVDGSESYTLRFKSLDTDGPAFEDEIRGVSYSVEWANDSRTVFYTTEDDAKRAHKLFRHELGRSGEDALIFHEPDELYRVGLGKTKDDVYLVMSVASIETSETRLMPADLSEEDFRLVEPRQAGVRYRLEHRDGVLYILTNEDAPNFKLMTAPADAPGKANWRVKIDHDPGIMLNGVDMFERFLVLYERRGGLKSIRVMDFETDAIHEIAFDEPVFTVSGGQNPMYRSRVLRFVYTSLTTPASVYDYDMESRERTLLKRQPVLGDFDPAAYQSERLFVTAEDGAKIPLFPAIA